MAYDNTNTGALFRNDEKDESHPNWPEYKGSINVGGQEFWLSAWLKTGKEGTKMAGKRFFSMTVQPKEDKAAVAKHTAQQKPAGKFDDMEDDIPF